MASSYKPDRAGMDALVQSLDMGRAMVQVAEVGRRWAESAAPRDSGEYAGSFQVRQETVRFRGRFSGDRAGAVLENTAPHAAAVEWRQGRHVLARAVDVIERGG